MLGKSIGTKGRLGAHIARHNAFSIPVHQSSNPSQHALLGYLHWRDTQKYQRAMTPLENKGSLLE